MPCRRALVFLCLSPLMASCSSSDRFVPPVAPGHHVRFIVDGANGKLESISGQLLGWTREWISVDRSLDKVESHFRTGIVMSVHKYQRDE